uniref:RING-type E3 ubiquitin transferase n=1 Tax=Setaria viridis TaxID=4556 RepID=A0A4U6T6X6_SETVI|nr:hypothetical protein SEVIR_9G432400v2 [Setaria viridis]
MEAWPDDFQCPNMLEVMTDPVILPSSHTFERSARALLLLTLDSDDTCVGLMADGVVDALAATALTSLATVDVNKCTIGAHPLVIPKLVGLLPHGSPREHREAAMALYELCKLPENRCRSAHAVEVLGLLTKCREGRQELRKIPDIVAVLSDVVLVLNWICSESNELALEAIKLGAF